MQEKAIQGLTPALVAESIENLIKKKQKHGYVSWDKRHRFERFTHSRELINYLRNNYGVETDFARLRKMCKMLIKAGLISVRREVGAMTKYSVWEFKGYTAEGNYFAENIN